MLDGSSSPLGGLYLARSEGALGVIAENGGAKVCHGSGGIGLLRAV